ncbi:uncharacterized protein [Musca autumnalis]|uniref:uncharacterized protein n=1 Tax=Musca autumnalis TaxID=221902 RepID=UPI003CF83FA6
MSTPNLIPKDLPKTLLTDEILMVIMDYFETCHQLITTMAAFEDSNNLLEKIFFDTLGGYLNYYLLPIAKYSYYAGLTSLQVVENILNLYQQCKNRLNTNGNGWKEPWMDLLNDLDVVEIKPLKIQHNDDHQSCDRLEMLVGQDLANDKMIVALPKLEADDADKGYLGNIWLPFKRKRIFDLKSPGSAYIMVQFYTTLSKCYHYEDISMLCYNREFKEWLLENIQIHLSDEVFYPGLGGILRILETIRRYPRRRQGKAWHQRDNKDYGYHQEDVMPMETERKKKSYLTAGGHDRKSKEVLNILRKSKHQQSYHPNMWSPDNYDHYNGDYNDYLEEELGGNTKQNQVPKATKNKIMKPKDPGHNITTSQEASGNSKDTIDFSWNNLSTYMIIMIVAIPLMALGLVLIVICCLKSNKKTNKEVRLRGYPRRKSTSLQNNNEEEMELLNAHSKSVVHGNNNNKSTKLPQLRTNQSRNLKYSNTGSTGSSSSSLMCQMPTKCFRTKHSGPAIIDTMSLNLSSSEAEDENSHLLKAKAVRIDEKPTTSSNIKAGGNKVDRRKAAKTKDHLSKK